MALCRTGKGLGPGFKTLQKRRSAAVGEEAGPTPVTTMRRLVSVTLSRLASRPIDEAVLVGEDDSLHAVAETEFAEQV